MINIQDPKISRNLATVSSWLIQDEARTLMKAVVSDTLTDEQLSWIDDPMLIPEDKLSYMGEIGRSLKSTE